MFSIIVAIGKKNEIGKNNGLLWNIPEDLKNFKKITKGKMVVMGLKTFESIGKPLAGRKNVILSRNKIKKYKIEKEYMDYDVEVCNSLQDFIQKYVDTEEEMFIIGGGEIYKQFLDRNIIKKLYISHINYENKEADTYFPKIDYTKWRIIKNEKHNKWDFVIYEKI